MVGARCQPSAHNLPAVRLRAAELASISAVRFPALVLSSASLKSLLASVKRFPGTPLRVAEIQLTGKADQSATCEPCVELGQLTRELYHEPIVEFAL
jgi:hypothetical protein